MIINVLLDSPQEVTKLKDFYILDESGTAENKEELLFSHDKLLLASIPRPLHQVTEEMLVQDNQGSHVHMCTGPPSQMQHRKIPTASYMGPTATVIVSVSTQTIISISHHCQHVPPYWYPPTPSPTLPFPLST